MFVIFTLIACFITNNLSWKALTKMTPKRKSYSTKHKLQEVNNASQNGNRMLPPMLRIDSEDKELKEFIDLL